MSSTPPFPPQGRKDAAEFTASFPKGTVGYVIHHAVTPFANWFGDFGSGTIGKHYREQEQMLALPATDLNIKKVAETETRYWNEQTGLPGMIGSSMSAQTREKILLCTKSKLDKEK